MSDIWSVNVAGHSYGPYPLDRMQAFIAEGRVLAQSLVMRNGEPEGRAGDDAVLGQFFAPKVEAEPVAEPEPIAEPEPEPVRAYEQPAQKFGRNEDPSENEPAHVIIIADMKSRSINGLEEVIYTLGSAYPIMPQMWLLTTSVPVNAIRNMLIQKLGKIDVLFIIDATHDKAAWFNFGPEQEARIRRIWGKPDATRKTG